MNSKKSTGASLENKKTILYLIGFVMVLSLSYIVLEWSREDIKVFKDDFATIEVPVDIEIPITAIAPPPPPPPPVVAPEIINVVKDNTPVVENPFTSEDKPEEGVPDPGNYIGPVSVDVEPEDVVIHAEIMPRFNGDVNKYLSENIKYPQIAIETYTQGRVVCQFVVNRDGSIVDVEVVRSVDASLDKEAVRVIKSMPKWKPGIQNGKPVRVKYYLPVNFRLM